ncbi:MAG TPA: hypothetical protein VFV77_05230, partial [Gammaproteobacteria bacterium]|nr:hypothetical protein [Gammaproteobacteria bacterium]
RGLWVMDDVASLRQVADARTDAPILFRPAVAVRVRRNENKDTPLPPEEPAGQNPPEGAIIDYWLPKDVDGPVKLEIDDAAGRTVRRYASDAPQTKLETDLYFNSAWLSPPEKLPAEAGGHRFVWDLRYPRPLALNYDYSIAAVYGRGGEVLPDGPLVLPGRYTVKLTAGGRTYSQPLEVTLDPRVSAKDAKTALPAQLKFADEIGESMRQSYTAHEEVAELRADVAKLKPQLAGASDAALAQSLAAFDAKAEELESKAKDRKNLRAINGGLAGLASEIGDSDRSPPAQYREAYEVYAASLKEALKQWSELRGTDLPKLDAALKARGFAPLEAKGP